MRVASYGAGTVLTPHEDVAATISTRQLKVHKVVEAAAVFVGVPFMLYLASQKKLPGWARLGALAFAGASLYVDGGLLLTWAAKARGEEGIFGDCGCGGRCGGCR